MKHYVNKELRLLSVKNGVCPTFYTPGHATRWDRARYNPQQRRSGTASPASAAGRAAAWLPPCCHHGFAPACAAAASLPRRWTPADGGPGLFAGETAARAPRARQSMEDSSAAEGLPARGWPASAGALGASLARRCA